MEIGIFHICYISRSPSYVVWCTTIAPSNSQNTVRWLRPSRFRVITAYQNFHCSAFTHCGDMDCIGVGSEQRYCCSQYLDSTCQARASNCGGLCLIFHHPLKQTCGPDEIFHTEPLGERVIKTFFSISGVALRLAFNTRLLKCLFKTI